MTWACFGVDKDTFYRVIVRLHACGSLRGVLIRHGAALDGVQAVY